MSWTTSRSNTIRTVRSPSWRRSPRCSYSSADDGYTDPWTRNSTSWCWCRHSCTALEQSSSRLPDSHEPRNAEASIDSRVTQGQQYGEQAFPENRTRDREEIDIRWTRYFAFCFCLIGRTYECPFEMQYPCSILISLKDLSRCSIRCDSLSFTFCLALFSVSEQHVPEKRTSCVTE